MSDDRPPLGGAFLGVLGGFGDVTHSSQLWRRMPSRLGGTVRFVAAHHSRGAGMPKAKGLSYRFYPFHQDDLLRFAASRLLYEICAVVEVASHGDVRFVYDRHRALGFAGLLAARLRRIPLVYEVNTLIEWDMASESLSNPLIAAVNRLNIRFQRRQFDLADALVSPQEGCLQILAEDYGIPKDKLVWIPNGADTEHFFPRPKGPARAEVGLPQDRPVILFVGGMKRWHGVDVIVRSAPTVLDRYPDALYVVVGDRCDLTTYEGLLDGLKIAARGVNAEECFLFTGRVPYDRVPHYMNAADVCISYFTGIERNRRISPMALKMLEYMACGRPIVATPPCDRDIKAGQAGAALIVEPDDPEALARGILALLEDPVKAEAMGKKARAYLVDHFTWDRSADDTERLIRNLVRMAEAPPSVSTRKRLKARRSARHRGRRHVPVDR